MRVARVGQPNYLIFIIISFFSTNPPAGDRSGGVGAKENWREETSEPKETTPRGPTPRPPPPEQSHVLPRVGAKENWCGQTQ